MNHTLAPVVQVIVLATGVRLHVLAGQRDPGDFNFDQVCSSVVVSDTGNQG